jgi:hypothetical protein
LVSVGHHHPPHARFLVTSLDPRCIITYRHTATGIACSSSPLSLSLCLPAVASRQSIIFHQPLTAALGDKGCFRFSTRLGLLLLVSSVKRSAFCVEHIVHGYLRSTTSAHTDPARQTSSNHATKREHLATSDPCHFL